MQLELLFLTLCLIKTRRKRRKIVIISLNFGKKLKSNQVFDLINPQSLKGGIFHLYFQIAYIF